MNLKDSMRSQNLHSHELFYAAHTRTVNKDKMLAKWPNTGSCTKAKLETKKFRKEFSRNQEMPKRKGDFRHYATISSS